MCNATLNSISVILWQPVHLSMLSWSYFNQYSIQYSFQATGFFLTCRNDHHQSREEYWPSRDRTSNLLFSNLAHYRLSYGALQYKSRLVWNSNYLTLSQTTNFRLFQTERVCRGQFQIWWQWQKVLQKVRKHCGKRRNYSLRANFSFFHSVFKILVLQTHKNQGSFGKGFLTIFNSMYITIAS